MYNYEIYVGFLPDDERDALIKILTRLGWFPEIDASNPAKWLLTVPCEDDFIFWSLVNKIMGIWEP